MVPSKLLKRLSHFVVGRPTPILIVLAALTAWAAFETRNIRFDFSPQSVNAGDRDALEFAEQFKRTFGYEDALIFVAVEATGENDVLDVAALQWQATVADALKALPHVSAVEAVPTLKLPQFNFADPQNVKIVPAVDRFPVDTATENRLRGLVDGSRMLEGTLVSTDRRVGAIVVSIDERRRDLEPMREDVATVRTILDANPPPEGYRLALAGLPILRTDIVNSLQGEQKFLLPIAAIFFVVVLSVVFRRLSGTFVPMLAVGVGMAWTVGVMGTTGQSFNILSNMLPVLLMIIGVSNSVHIVCRYAEESRRFREDRKSATIETIEQMAVACLLTFVTTAIGFGSLASARSEILRDFGWQAALGVLLMYVSLMLVMGALLRFFPAPGTGATAGRELSPISRGMSAFANAVARHPLPSVGFVLAVVAASFWVARDLTVNSSMIETYEPGHPTVEALRLVEDKLGGILPIEVSLKAQEPGQFLEPAIYRKVAEFSDYARQEPAVLFARSYVDIHQDVYANFRKQPELYKDLPADDDRGADRIGRTMNQIERAGEAIPYHVFVARDGEQARILLRVRDVGTRQLLELIERLEASLSSLFPPGSHVAFRLTGDAYLNARSMDGFVRDLFVSLVTAAVTIFAIISVLFRSLGLGLIAAIPNTTPLAVTLGYMGLRGYDLNAGNVIVFTISLGIAVDDTIHFLTRYREEMAKENDVWKAIERSYHGTGRAIVLMTLLIVCGLSVLFLSDFVPTRRFAELTTLTMVAALFGDLLLLPASLVLFRKRAPAPKAAPIPEPDIAGRPAGRRQHEPTRGRRESD